MPRPRVGRPVFLAQPRPRHRATGHGCARKTGLPTRAAPSVLEDTELDVPLTDVPRDDPETVSDDLVEVHHATVTHALGEATRERCPECRDLREARRLAHREDLPARGRDDLAYELGQ